MYSEPKPAKRPALSIGRWIVFVAATAAIGVAAACGSDTEPDAAADAGDDGAAETGPSIDTDGGGGNDAGAPGECVPPSGFDDCTGRCGPIRNPCTGVIVKQCGGCQGGADAGPLVCDLETNTCIKPKLTCEDFGAECGRIRNSCGAYIDCPTGPAAIECSAGDPDAGLAPQECDPDTKKCRTATSVTCADLGHECGMVWLGIGPKTNLTNCGDCSNHPDRPRCNSGLIPEYNVCEPACTPPSTNAERLALCNAAKAARGVECGFISDGCGGAINCSEVSDEFRCPSGQQCGQRGIANRCDPAEPPVECVAAGRNCGTIQSVCTGTEISCGECSGTDVCNANGVCGPPCVPKTCADLGNPECLPSATPVPDGCGGIVSDCPVCPGGEAACQPSTDGGVGGTCCVPKYSCTNRPPGVDANACGNQLFDNGCGVMLNCGCSGGGSCVDGMCCTPSACPAPGAVGETCGTVSRGCNQTCNRGCANDPQGNNNVCNGGTCCNPEPDSAEEWRTQHPGRCQFNIPNGCGGVIDAPCTGSAVCINVENGPGTIITDPGGTTPSAMGWCCSNPNANCNSTTMCTSVPNACVSGQTVNCGAGQCPNGADESNDEVCFEGACCDPEACPSPRPAGSACGSNSFDRGCGLRCNPGCANDADGNSNPCYNGQCCNREPDNANEWRADHPGECAFNISDGCGNRLDAPCGSGQVCQNGGVQVVKTGTTFSSGTCCTTADSCGGTPKAVGEDCRVPNQCLNGQTVTCQCAGSAVCYQDKCCQPSACPAQSGIGGPCGTVDRGCGQTCNRGCSAGTCYQGTCCQPSACPPPANIGESCGTTSRGCGQTCNRACDTSGNKGNNKCVSGTCQCTPDTCPPGFTGSMNDGCGKVIACTGG